MTFPVFIKASRSRVSISKEIREVNRLRLQFERSMTSRMLAIFKRVGKRAAEEYKINRGVDRALIPLEREIELAFRAHYEAVIERFGDRVYENRKLERFVALSRDYFERFGADKVVAITETTRRQIRRAIVQGENEGLRVEPIARLITERTGGSIGRARAATISRTETHAAASYATHTATKELNLPAQRKRWVSVSDGRTRDHHRAANGQEVGIDDKFIIRFRGAEIEMNYPHDGSGGAANNINCRCLAIYFTDEDALFDDFQLEGEEVTAEVDAGNKPEIDLYDITQGPLRDGLNATLNRQLSPLMARVAARYPKPNQVVAKPRAGVYYTGSRRLETDLDDQTAAHEYGHHIDHMIGIDENAASISQYWSAEGLKAAWLADRKAFGTYRKKPEEQDKRLLAVRRELYNVETKSRVRPDGTEVTWEVRGGLAFEGADGMSDIVDSFVNGKFYSKYHAHGHGYTYWKNRQGWGAQAEAFANLYAIQNSPKAVEWAEKNIPNLWAAFTAKMRDIDANNPR